MRFLRYSHGPVLSVATSNVLNMDLSPLEALDALEAATETALAVLGKDLWRLPEPEVERVLARMQALESRHAALRLKVVREVDTRGVPATHGAPSLKSYLIQTLRMSPALAGETARVSDSLATRHSATGEALAEARVSYEQAKAISELIDGLPKIATFEQKDRAEAFLLAQRPSWTRVTSSGSPRPSTPTSTPTAPPTGRRPPGRSGARTSRTTTTAPRP